MEQDANFGWVKADRHVDPLEEVGIDPHVPKDPHVDPLEEVGIDPVGAGTPFGDVEDTLPDIAEAGIIVGR